jgi:uncharacterized protein YegP (UPF0339 family)
MDTKIETSGARENYRGTRHLRIGIEIHAASANVVSMWLVDQPAVQATRLVGEIITRVDLGHRPVLVEAFADPRVTRGTYRPQVGHAFRGEESGIVHVSVPFTNLSELDDVRIRVVDTGKTGRGVFDPASVSALFDKPLEGTAVVADINAATLSKHPDWSKVVEQDKTAAGVFEIYALESGQFAWRLRRAGVIIAEASKPYATRRACLEEIKWIQTHAESLPVVGQ